MVVVRQRSDVEVACVKEFDFDEKTAVEKRVETDATKTREKRNMRLFC